jgi:hypothetical protein
MSNKITHETHLAEAISFFKKHDIEPFHVIDIQIFHVDDKITNRITCVCVFNIFGTFTNISESINKNLVPYLLLASGHFMPEIKSNHSQDPGKVTFFDLYIQKREERQAWLSTEMVTLDKFDGMAHTNLRLEEESKNTFKVRRQLKAMAENLKMFNYNDSREWYVYNTEVHRLDPPMPTMRLNMATELQINQ